MRFRSLSVAVCAVSLAVAGCAGGPAPAPQAAKPAPAQPPVGPVAWSNRLCGLIGGFMAAQLSGPQVDKSTPEKFKASSIAQIDSAAQTAAATQEGLRAMGPAPVAGGEHLTGSFVAGFGKVQDVLHAARARAEAVNPADQQAFTAGMTGVQEELRKGEGLNFSQEFAEFEQQPELNAASGQAPACKALTAPPPPR